MREAGAVRVEAVYIMRSGAAPPAPPLSSAHPHAHQRTLSLPVSVSYVHSCHFTPSWVMSVTSMPQSQWHPS